MSTIEIELTSDATLYFAEELLKDLKTVANKHRHIVLDVKVRI